MVDVKAATNPVAQSLVIGDKIATPTADGKVQLASKDGKDKVSLDIDQFKKYLQEHQSELAASNPIGDTTSFKSKKADEATETNAEPKKGGLSKLSKLIIAAGLATVAVIYRKNLSAFFKGIVEKFKGSKNTQLDGAKKITAEPTKLYDGSKYAQARGVSLAKDLDKEINAISKRTSKAAHSKKQVELEKAVDKRTNKIEF